MKWRKRRRADRSNLVEFICECGVGHPSYGSALWIAEAVHGPDSPEVDVELQSQLVHACCGCCSKPAFPGTPERSLRHAHGLIRKYQKEIRQLKKSDARG